MNAIEHLLQQPAAQAIGWALLQFVWQGALVGPALGSRALCAAAQRRRRPLRRRRHRPVADADDAGGHGASGVALDDGRTAPAAQVGSASTSAKSGAVERSRPTDCATGPDVAAAPVAGTACRCRPTRPPAAHRRSRRGSASCSSPGFRAWSLLTLRLLAGWVVGPAPALASVPRRRPRRGSRLPPGFRSACTLRGRFGCSSPRWSRCPR